ncbi:BZ3500_MvSof-1268-A1-R1_Chr3-1g05661 [Microbotryum saponariae]|uniref:BZ3500_MvSof-1268-A1-R1_Chr3-1g05661 protein n=1 Tax=Microbotryum saponariae TaxID=289078 RepID=A0A2X0MWG2_9BASI|nr:BZ3500_MvSof-1268-A1-R1_Chr3-1g05661 [Microbotryum saponariae]SDA04851.1 BZ3501_MvSof-1269-A2-R1_Chr3-1g05331 [Microbotryum saponariae]
MEPRPALIADLTETLDRLCSPTSSLRTTAEAHLHSELLCPSHTAQTLLALVHVATSLQGTSPRRVQALIILRRTALQSPTVLDLEADRQRDDHDHDPTPTHPALLGPRWSTLPLKTKDHIENRLLGVLGKSDMRPDAERKALCDTIAEIYKLNQPGPWPQFASVLSQLFSSPSPSLRESCFRLYAECIDLLEQEPPTTASQGLLRGLQDPAIHTRLAALQAASKLLQVLEPPSKLQNYAELIRGMLEILPALTASAASDDRPLTTALLEMIELASIPRLASRVFKPHVSTLTHFCTSIIQSPESYDENLRASALELLVSLAETAPTLIRTARNFAPTIVEICLDLMKEREDDPEWLGKEVIKDVEEDDTIATIAEQSLDRFAQRLGKDVFGAVQGNVGKLLGKDKTWQVKSAGLSAIAAIAEGCRVQMEGHLEQIINAIMALAGDDHPRVRYATIYALGQLCTDLEDQVQAEFGQQVLRVFVSNMLGQEPRLQAFAAAACVNFFRATEVVEPLKPFLPDVVRGLLHLLQTGSTFVQGNALEALTVVAAYMEEEFAPVSQLSEVIITTCALIEIVYFTTKYYTEMMPHLLRLLETEASLEIETLRARALDCASNIAAAVDPSVFEPDASRLIKAMQNISKSLPEDDQVTRPYLLTAFCHLAATVGAEAFAPYINETFPQLLKRAARDAQVTIGEVGEPHPSEYNEEGEDDWESVLVDGKTVSIRTSAVDDKLEAVQNLISLVSTLGATLPLPELQQVVQTTLPLLNFVWHIGIREAAAALIAVTVQSLALHPLNAEERTFICSSCSDALAPHLCSDTDAEFLATALSSIATVYTSFPRGTLRIDSRNLCIRAMEGQFVDLARREQERQYERGGDHEEDAEYLDEEVLEIEEGEKQVYYGINVVVKELMKQHDVQSLDVSTSTTSTTFPLAVFEPALKVIATPSGQRLNAAQFGLRLVCDMLDQLGERAVETVQPYLNALAARLHDENPTIRRVSAYAVGIAVERAPSSLQPWAITLVDSLFAAIAAIAAIDPSDLEQDPDVLAARDNAVSALSKIIRRSPPATIEPILERWVLTLPILVDEDEFEHVYPLLIDLLHTNHPSTTSPTVATHILKVLVQTLQQETLPPTLEESLCTELKNFVAKLPQGSEARVQAESIPQDVRDKLGAW